MWGGGRNGGERGGSEGGAIKREKSNMSYLVKTV